MSDKPFFFSLVAFPAVLSAGLLILWLVAVYQPWEWLVDHLGVIRRKGHGGTAASLPVAVTVVGCPGR